jgi:PKD repeat protein
VPTEELYAGKFPNFKEGPSYNRVECVSTDCSGAPFGLFSDFLDEGSNTPPFAFVDAPASGQAGAPVQFDATASYDPDGDPLTFSWDFGDGNLGSGPTPSHTYQTAGMFTVALTLSDGNGGIDTAAVNVDVQQGANQPPNAVIGGPYSGSEDGPINFDGSASSDPDEDPLTYTWDFGDGTVGSGETPSHTYAYGGNFTVTLTVADGISGEDTAETTVSVQEVNDQPVAVHNGPFTAETGQPIQFDASGSYDADNLDSTPTNDQTLSYLWDFGDGSTSSEVSPTHAYAASGEFTVSLTVDDGSAQNGTMTVFTSAVISETAPSGSHVGDLDGSRITNRNRWIATVTVAVHDDQHSPVAGAVVTGSWSGGFTGSDTCTTNSSGYCSVATDQILKKNPSVIFSIEDISHNTLAYNQALNHDPDADSNGTAITVYLDQVTDPTPTPTPPPTAGDLHIGDLDGEAMTVRSKWAARVFITAHDENEAPLAGVTVTGVWSVGGEASCITDTNGICSITKNNLKTSVPSITFQVTDAALNGYSYLSASNHDPDGNSDGITINILAP